LIAQGHGPIRQPAVRGLEGIGERIEGIAPLPELVELGSHLVEGAVLVAGATLELRASASASKASHRSQSWWSLAVTWSKAP
jgi:hypothetical protein